MTTIQAAGSGPADQPRGSSRRAPARHTGVAQLTVPSGLPVAAPASRWPSLTASPRLLARRVRRW